MNNDMETIASLIESQSETAQSLLETLTPALNGFILASVIACIFWVLYFFLTKAVRRYMLANGFRKKNSQTFFLVWRYSWLFVGSVFVLFALSGSLATLGLSAAFLGMVLGWSLQAPVTGIAAWLMVMVKRPFRIGDRIIIDGIIGDVTDISLTHISLNQVGGTVSGEDPSGRGVLIPNAMLFSTKIFNYSFEGMHLLDEVSIKITYTSDLHRAEAIVLKAAQEETADIIAETKKEPYVRISLVDSGVDVRLRYQTNATSRSKIASAIQSRIFDAFRTDYTVTFAFPHMQIVYDQKHKSVE
jgi:small-conductance mechanosensitive channel